MQLLASARMFVSNIRKNPKGRLASIMPDLQRLKADLISARSAEDKLSAIVLFFDIVSRWHDRRDDLIEILAEFQNANHGKKHDVPVLHLTILCAHLLNAGRNLYGMNRTITGQVVGDDNVYLGDRFGLFTKTVRHWKTTKNEPKGSFAHFGGNMAKFNSYDIVSDQAETFMNSHIGSMIGCIDRLQESVA